METHSEGSAEIVPVASFGREAAVQDVPLRDEIRARWLIAQRSPNTRVAYQRDIDSWFAWCDRGGADVLTAEPTVVDLYRHWLQKPGHADRRIQPHKGYSDASVARKIVSVSSFYRYAKRRWPQHIPRNPCEDVNRPEVSDESLTAGMDLAEARALLAAAEGSGIFEHALLGLLLGVGLRVSEVCTATTDDLGVERGHRTITVTRKGGKRSKLPIPAGVAATLDTYLGGRTGPLFIAPVRPVTRQQVAYRLGKLATDAGISGKRITPHSLRHTAATLALDAGASIRDVQDMLGHRDPRTTNRYDRARGKLDRSPVHALARALSEPDESLVSPTPQPE